MKDFVIENGMLVEYTGEGGSVVIPEGVTIIGNSAFFGCMKLTSVKIPEGVIRIDGSAFFGCSNLTDVVIPNSVTDIGNSAFFDCGLIHISIPASVTNIGNSVFGYCQSLTSITVDKNNVNYTDIDGNLYSKDGRTFIQYAAGKTETEFMVPYGVAVVGVSAFEGCKSLTYVETPESVERIVDGAFSQCESLTEVSIRGPKTDISFFAFEACGDVLIVQTLDSDESCVQ
jgi:putative transposon-encoded protein